ncbi:MAG: hypothetical protein ACYDC1_03315 [Limisphaerales bacterium]
MNLSQLTVADLKQLGRLLEEREGLQAKIDALNSQLERFGGQVSAPAPTRVTAAKAPAAAGKKPQISAEGLERIAAAQRRRWAKQKSTPSKSTPAKPASTSAPALAPVTAVKPALIVTAKPAKPAKAKSGKPGKLKEAIVALVKSSGKTGITVKEIAVKVGVNAQRIYVWFNSTGRKVKEIKKVGPAKYGWQG